MNETEVLKIEQYCKHFQLHERQKTIPSTQNINLSVHQGQLTALVGPTGSGKSSVLKGVYRTYLPASGRILYRNPSNQIIDLAQADEQVILGLRRDEIGFVTQFFYALPRKSTLEIVAQPLYQKGIAPGEARTRASEILTMMQIHERLWEVSPATFSGGEKQRVNLARSFVTQPRLLLLDEPTASLDAATTEVIIHLIEKLKQEGTAILAIFHQQELVQRLADEVVTLEPPFSLDIPE